MRRGFALIICIVTLLSGASCTSMQQKQPPSASAQWYMATMYQQIKHSRTQMPVFELAGQAAARRIVNGGLLWVGGSQEEFAMEAVGRTGGLAGAKKLDLDKLFRNDVVLYAARGPLAADDLRIIAQCKQKNAYVIAFADANGSPRLADGPDVLFDSGAIAGLPARGGICPLDTVTNIMNLWIFTGEFASGCTRLGKMPVFLAGTGRSNGADRDAKYAGQTLHYDMIISPISPGVLGGAYLDHITKMLVKVEHDDIDEVTQSGRWVASAGAKNAAAQFASKIYPDHFRDHRAPQPFAVTAGPNDPAPDKGVLIHISYQRPPQELIDSARRARRRLFYCSVLRGQGGLSEYTLYALPHWPIEDACVEASGYDIPILPASSVMQATLYWSIVAEAQHGR